MPKTRVLVFSVSLDGFSAGPNQDLEHPLGVGGGKAFDWFFHTRTFLRMQGRTGGETGIDDDIASKGFDNIGAGSSAETCSDQFAVSGPTTSGRDGGATSRRIMCRCMYSRITRALPSK